ncbi:hypothetical protein N866_05675 [Actinotalea ferrariae CF5-4]|uniref:2-oxoisovalerate dehydrogenase subunit alpha n=1 Tax=Actinotalea ferrariae CF5-4 TaxID=948458 RepID=A0A021VNJ9_9CELL|nr:hypothetical protein N866_05675 [Actinotalea ferrariae CF5-4]
MRVDGNDVLAVHAVMLEALERARSGGGPTFVEAYTYRMGAHTTSDDPTRYRSAAEEEEWRAKDPIDRLRAYLASLGELPEAFLETVAADAEALGRHVRATVRAMEAPPKPSMFDHVYATPNAVVDRERGWFTEYEAAFEDAAPTGGAR